MKQPKILPKFTKLTLNDIARHVTDLGFEKSTALCRNLAEVEQISAKQIELEERLLATFGDRNGIKNDGPRAGEK